MDNRFQEKYKLHPLKIYFLGTFWIKEIVKNLGISTLTSNSEDMGHGSRWGLLYPWRGCNDFS